MDQAEAGPSRSPLRRQGSSSDDVQDVSHLAKPRSRSKAKHLITGDVAQLPAYDNATEVGTSSRGRRIPRTGARGSTIRPATRASSAGKGKAKARPVGETILVDDSTDEDEDEDKPVFVGQSLAKKLAQKYTFKSVTSVGSSDSSASAEASSAISTKPAVADEKPKPTPIVLQPPAEPTKPPPVPAWLGKTSILLQIPHCVVCKVRWKKENGAARWRHISTCLPPLYRPPNPPPDLPQLIHEALIETYGFSTPSLLEIHMSAFPEVIDRRVDVKPAGKKGPAKVKGLAKMINVRPAEERGDIWEGEVDDRVTTMLGRPRTPDARSPSARSAVLSPLSSPGTAFPSTQPLGNSDLANRYTRDLTTVEDVLSLEIDKLEGIEDEEDEEYIPMPPASQKHTAREEDQENDEPFRSRGGLRADGGLPNKRSAIWQDWGQKRYRPDTLASVR